MFGEINRYVEKRLNHWAAWYLRNLDGGYGYSNRSIEKRLIEEGGYIVLYENSRTTPFVDESAEELNKFLDEMKQYNDIIANSLFVEYLLHKPQPVKAKILDLSTTQYKVYIGLAKAWLSGRLLPNYISKNTLS